jgi:hypothetical protein
MVREKTLQGLCFATKKYNAEAMQNNCNQIYFEGLVPPVVGKKMYDPKRFLRLERSEVVLSQARTRYPRFFYVAVFSEITFVH